MSLPAHVVNDARQKILDCKYTNEFMNDEAFERLVLRPIAKLVVRKDPEFLRDLLRKAIGVQLSYSLADVYEYDRRNKESQSGV